MPIAIPYYSFVCPECARRSGPLCASERPKNWSCSCGHQFDAVELERSCLTCRSLSASRCIHPNGNRNPVDTAKPFTDCPVWEMRVVAIEPVKERCTHLPARPADKRLPERPRSSALSR
jgi:hypothetical protein